MGAVVAAAYRDAWALVQAMWPKLLALIGLALAGGVVGGIASLAVKTPLGDAVFDVLVAVGVSWLIAPYFVSLYRFLLRGETGTPRRDAEITRLFFAWSALLDFVVSLPSLLTTVLSGFPGVDFEQPGWAALSLLVSVLVWLFALRIVTLLPAIADGRPMTLSLSFKESRGHFWFVLGSTLLIVLPALGILIAGALLLAMLLGRDAVAPLAILAVPLMAAVALAGLALSASLSRRFALTSPPDQDP